MAERVSLEAQTESVVEQVKALLSRFAALAALKANDGRTISIVNKERLAKLRDVTREILAGVDSLLEDHEPEDKRKAAEELSELKADFLRGKNML